MKNHAKGNGSSRTRCAIYTRKSTEEGLDQDFNTLDAQRESAEAFITSQTHEGWTCLADRYDDGGFSGGNIERPALKRLLADIEAGKIDCVVVYKVDRLSRSLLDFARMMEVFDRHHVAFVSVTQQFNTASSMGRLILNVLLSFAQFEREMISERTRDKMSAARRKGKYVGGAPLLGFEIEKTKLVVNKAEAQRVRQIFGLYLKYGSLLPTVQELNRRSWTTKAWTTKKRKARGGVRFNKTNLHNLLTNVAYVGKVQYNGDIFAGEHAAIIDAATFERVQELLRHNNRMGEEQVRNRSGALLKGLLRCGPCGCAMTPAHSTSNGSTRYHYYTCINAQKRGWQTCPGPSVPAAAMERFVVDQIEAIGRDPVLLAETLAPARQQAGEALTELARERRAVERDMARSEKAIRKLAAQVGPRGEEGRASARLAKFRDRVRVGERRLAQIREETERLQGGLRSEADAAEGLRAFAANWESLGPREQARFVEQLVERVEYDGREGAVSVTLRPSGIQALVEEFAIEESAV